MRLITKITLLFLLTTLVVFAIGGVMSYYIIKKEIDAEHQRFLRRRIERATELVRQHADLPQYDGDKMVVIPLGHQGVPSDQYVYSDTVVWHPYLKRMEQHYKVSAVRSINGSNYYFETFDVIVETDDIMETVIESLSRTYLLLLLAVVAIGALVSARIFQPFNDTLRKIKSFRVRDPQPMQLRSTTTREFSRLNHFVEQMAERSRREYQALKEFSENASHEMQTPLSIARGKLELLLESPNLKGEDIHLLLSTQQSLDKLSKLGHSLSMLTKIENEEFSNVSEIDLSQVVRKNVEQFIELAHLKNLSFEHQIEEPVPLRIDPSLADMLVTNLLQNAIRHNRPGGRIDLELTRHSLRICNTGDPPDVPPEEFFRRFRKGQQSGESLGLGLAIVKRICEFNQLTISYKYQNAAHVVEVDFPAE